MIETEDHLRFTQRFGDKYTHLMSAERLVTWAKKLDFTPQMLCGQRFRPAVVSKRLREATICPACRLKLLPKK